MWEHFEKNVSERKSRKKKENNRKEGISIKSDRKIYGRKEEGK